MSDESGSGSSPLGALSDQFAKAIAQAGQSVVSVFGRHRFPSSGIQWRPGVIVTANHTIERDEELAILLPEGQTVPVVLVGRDPNTDLAVLRSEASFPVATIADASQVQVGHLVLAVGRAGDGDLSASMGVISAVGSTWLGRRGRRSESVFRPDLTFYPGFSGGALIDVSGQVIGLNTSGLSRRMDLTIPANRVEQVIDQLLATGRIPRGYLGVGMQPVRISPRLQQGLGLAQDGGVIVLSVESDSPADRSGLMVGDVLLKLDEGTVSDTSDVLALLTPDRIGRTIAVDLVRGGSKVQLTLTIGERPWGGD